MGKIAFSTVQEILFATSDRKASRRITVLLKDKRIRKIAPRVYTSNVTDSPAVIIRRNWYYILSNLFPGALLSHRSAFEFKPTSAGHIFLSYSYTANVRLPGLTVHLLRGPKPLAGDNSFFEKLFAAQEARAFLENLQQSRKQGEESKTLPVATIEQRLEAIIRARGEQAVNGLRDNARKISARLGMKDEFNKLNMLISALMATGKSTKLTSPVALARALGEPVDPARLKLFEILYEALAGQEFPEYKAFRSTDHYKAVAFFEGYFSNYIEGTEFTVLEARQIIDTDRPMPSRDEDSHDILGTYRIVSDRKEMGICPDDPAQFFDLLRRRHAILLQSRRSMRPGEFKDINNRAGNTEFVDWSLVYGTLKRGFDWYTLLRAPFAKAVYMMFLVSEVHPFLDGNGRIARVMMNAELSAKGLAKIIIPTVYRDDYMGALRKLTRQQKADGFIRMMSRAYDFSATLSRNNPDEMERYLRSCDAFEEPEFGKLRFEGRREQ